MRKSIRDILTKELLYRLYYEEKKSIYVIAKEYDVCVETVRKAMKFYGFERNAFRKLVSDLEKKISKETLDAVYWGKNGHKPHSMQEIADLYDTTRDCVDSLIQKLGIPVKNFSEAVTNSFEKMITREELTRLYHEEKLSQTEIADKYNVQQTAVSELMRKWGIESRTSGEALMVKAHNNPNINFEFFEKPSHDFYYLLGLLLTDGCLTDDNRITLSLADKDTIEWVVGKIGYKNKIGTRRAFYALKEKRRIKNPKTQYTIAFTYEYVVEILKKYNMTSRKSKSLICPDIPQKYIPDFIRGAMDGDGGIYPGERKDSKKGAIYAHFMICSASYQFLDKIKEFIMELIDFEPSIRQDSKGVYVLSIQTVQKVIELGKQLYKNDAYGMKRKKDNFLEIFELGKLIGIQKPDTKGEKNSNAKISEETAKKIIEMIKNSVEQEEIAELLGVSLVIVQCISQGITWSHLTGGPGWRERYFWDKMFSSLMEYKKENGDCRVPRDYKMNKELSLWVEAQRQHYRNNELPEERKKKLDSIGFVWGPHEDSWNKMFFALKEYIKENGDCLVPSRYEKNKKLGAWVVNQRVKYKNKQLSKDKMELLNSIKFVWDPKEAFWNEMYEELKKYKKIQGDCLVPAKYKDNKKLGTWVDSQRTQYKKRNLSDDKISKLNAIGFVWSIRAVSKV